MTALSPRAVGAPVVLSCLSLDGSPRYDLPGWSLGDREDFDVFWRPAPARVDHYQKRKSLTLPRGEFVLVGPGRPYIISLSVTDAGAPAEAYININLPPEPTERGWCWRDLELDLKALPDYTGRWSTYVIDVNEFRAADYSIELWQAANNGVEQAYELVAAAAFPFSADAQPWLGGPPPADLLPA